jgi:Beta-ketoacyl synthase, N-terminal domain
MKVQVCGVGLLGPGLADWAQGAALLYQAAVEHLAPGALPASPDLFLAPTAVPAPQRLPATERRRAGTVVKASLVAADQAVAAAGLDAARMPTVFTSSTGDPSNCHLLCEALAQPERVVSPTRFTNSVHNAAAGYWHIALQSRAPSTSLAAFDASFCAGLLEAAVQCLAALQPVLLVACDVPYPEPLHSLRPVVDVFAVALVLAPPAIDRASPVFELRAAQDDEVEHVTLCKNAALEALRHSVPAARALPLLQALATCAVKGTGAVGARPARVVLQGAPAQGLVIQVHSAPVTGALT